MTGEGGREPAARLQGIRKSYRSVIALDGADLTLFPGEVHGVLGENGAGKTTLLSVLGGSLQADAGVLEVRGSSVSLRSPRDAWSHGVGMVHQHFTLVPRLTVLENLALGFRDAAGGWGLALDAVRGHAEELTSRTGLTVPFDALVEALSVGDRQRIEILKALLREPEILILDEPTALLTPGEVSQLFDLLRELTDEGIAVVLVAHKLDEVLAVSHRVTVMRAGRSVLSAGVGEVDSGSLTRAMVGSEPPSTASVPPAGEGPVVAELDDVRLRGRRGEWALDGVSLSLRRGEIVGVAGVEGNGQRELAMVLAGVVPPEQGVASLPQGVGFISQDRSREGLVADFDLSENMALALHRRGEYRRGAILDWQGIRERTVEAIAQYDVRAPGPGTRARALSGGNQQRLIVAREMAEAANLLVAENATRGLDVRATAFVHQELRRLARREGDAAPAVVLISTDLEEILALAHRIVVMVRGRLVQVPQGARTKEALGALMLSGDHAPA